MVKVIVEENGQTEAKLDGEFVLAATFEKIEGGAQILIAGVGGIQPKDFMIMLGRIVVEPPDFQTQPHLPASFSYQIPVSHLLHIR